MEDQYLILVENGFYHYYKNKKLHREAGPAFFSEEYKDEYLKLGDENIYQLTTEKTEIITNLVLQYMGVTLYYLNGVFYEKEIFEKIVLNNQLNKELPNYPENKKKLKI